MYCSISDAWNQENTMANLAKRFNREHFSNNQIEYFDLNNDIKGNDSSNSNYGDINNQPKVNTEKIQEVTKIQEAKKIEETPVPEIKTKEVIREKVVERKYSCEELVNKVLSCEECRQLLGQRLNFNNFSIQDSMNNLFTGTNKEIIILILIGLIIIILLDLFLRIGSSLN